MAPGRSCLFLTDSDPFVAAGRLIEEMRMRSPVILIITCLFGGIRVCKRYESWYYTKIRSAHEPGSALNGRRSTVVTVGKLRSAAMASSALACEPSLPLTLRQHLWMLFGSGRLASFPFKNCSNLASAFSKLGDQAVGPHRSADRTVPGLDPPLAGGEL